MAEKEDYTKDVGPAGPTGPTGSTGPQGIQGETGPPGTTTWVGITDKPSTFPPEAHHASHETGGTDPVDLLDLVIKYSLIFGG